MDSMWESNDLFSRLPDEMVFLIFNKMQDAKSLCVSLAVCRRFRTIAPQVDRIFLPIPMKKGLAAAAAAPGGGGGGEPSPKSLVKNAVMRTLMKPFSFISQMMKSKQKGEVDGVDCSSYHVPNEVLKPFGEIRRLHLRLPCHENRSKTGGDPAALLKWKAEFGRELRSCVILGAKSWRPKDATAAGGGAEGETRVMVDEELRLRIVWTISCLIAASARHFLVGETVRGQQMIENLVVSDESDQGRLCMNREMLEEMRESKVKDDGPTTPAAAAAYRSKVPALKIKMWYLEKLEVGGKVMEGATLVIVRPNVPEAKNGIGFDETAATAATAFGEEAEGKVFGEAVKKLMVAKKCYTLEMNSF